MSLGPALESAFQEEAGRSGRSEPGRNSVFGEQKEHPWGWAAASEGEVGEGRGRPQLWPVGSHDAAFGDDLGSHGRALERKSKEAE